MTFIINSLVYGDSQKNSTEKIQSSRKNKVIFTNQKNSVVAQKNIQIFFYLYLLKKR